MSATNAAGLVLAGAITVFLVLALIFPERF
ncbi:MAG TPA: potassium-transporting ATPase subunit F [Rugosimonospora sp.]|nr:potassium-transporting ATPase subunit F [Rugosimonospora sp.]